MREVLDVIGEFLSSLTPKIRSLLEVLFEQFSGEKVGRDVAAFYTQIRNSGLDEDAAKEMTFKYFEERTSIIKILNEILSTFTKAAKGAEEGEKT